MRNFFLFSARTGLSVLGLVLVFSPGLATAQSRIISADPSASETRGSGSRTIQLGTLPGDNEVSALSLTNRNLEQILDMPFDAEYDEHPFIDVMDDLQDNYQVDVILDQSAKDDSLTEDDPITFKANGIRLKNALHLMLKEKNATFIIGNETLQIISLDVASDPEYFLSEFYPMDYIAIGNYDELVDDIKASIDPEGWYDTNGDAHINTLVIDGQPSISLFGPYSTHLQLRTYLSNLQRIAPGGGGRQLVTSQVIQLPAARVKRQPKKKKGYGIGGFGGGGGVF
jgi:hypothetical protein